MSGPEPGGFQVFSDLDEATYSALKESIAARGVLVPIAVDQDQRIIDGHNRARAARELGVECPQVVVHVEDHQDGRDVALLLNTVRRHLDVEQRRSVVADLRAAGHSLRAIAGAVGVTQTTVRNDLDKSGVQGCTPERSTGQDGKSYPATTPKRVCAGGCGTVLGPRAADDLCAECAWEEPPADDTVEVEPAPVEPEPAPTPTPAPKPKRPSDEAWEPYKALAKGIRNMPTAREVMSLLPPDSVTEFDLLADTAIAWGKRWKEERKAATRLRLMGVK